MMPRRLPHSPEAEMMFLGSQLLEPDRKLGNGLQHSHFALNEHGWLFAAIRQAQSAGIRFDAIAAEHWIVNDARFDSVGGRDYIAKLFFGNGTGGVGHGVAVKKAENASRKVRFRKNFVKLIL